MIPPPSMHLLGFFLVGGLEQLTATGVAGDSDNAGLKSRFGFAAEVAHGEGSAVAC